jgi:hypothetical protein
MALAEFIAETLCATFYKKGETSQPDLSSRLRPYNTERLHQGYCNMGHRLIETIRLSLKSVTQEG